MTADERERQILRICRHLRPDYDVNLYNRDGTENPVMANLKFAGQIWPLRGMTEHERREFKKDVTDLFDLVIAPHMTFRK
jgi:hypothetical protein